MNARTLGIVKILGRFLGLLFISSIVIFVMLRAVPGDPARIALGVGATDEAVAQLSSQLGTDRPLLTQYGDWIGGLITGDFGISLASQQDLTPIIVDRAQVSLIICLAAIILSTLIALPLGTWAARRAGHADGTIIQAATQVGIAIPSFLAGVLLVGVFAVQLGWLPPNGWVPPDQGFSRFVSRLILPVLALAAVQAAILTRYVRSAILEVMRQDYIRTARAQGASLSQALTRHGLRNAALPLLTVVGIQLTSLIVGAVVIERVFLIPGLGSLLLDSLAQRDLIAVQTIVMLLVMFTLAVTALMDVAYRLIDPRTKR